MTGPCAVIVLAAGLSSRMGGRNKLLLPLAGQPLVRHSVAHALSADVGPVIVVTGHQHNQIENALAGCSIRFVYNSDFAQGMATSIVAGLRAAAETSDCCLMLLGDMPLIGAETIKYLVNAAGEAPDAAAAVPVFRGEWAHPVILRRKIFAEILQLRGDGGARKILAGRADVLLLPVEDEGTVLDADTPEAFAQIQRVHALRHGVRIG